MDEHHLDDIMQWVEFGTRGFASSAWKQPLKNVVYVFIYFIFIILYWNRLFQWE